MPGWLPYLKETLAFCTMLWLQLELQHPAYLVLTGLFWSAELQKSRPKVRGQGEERHIVIRQDQGAAGAGTPEAEGA